LALKVLVVDDTAVFRKVVSDALALLPDVEVVGTANHGRAALARIAELKPDLVTLDIEMPEMDGVEVLQALKNQGSSVGVLVLSALTTVGGAMTMKALQLGAFDFITKPSGGGPERNRDLLRAELEPRVKAFSQRLTVRRLLAQARPGGPAAPPPRPALPPRPPAARPARPEMVVIGVSTGGPTALVEILGALPADLGVPVLIVQHMPAIFTRSLAESLCLKSKLRVKEAEDGEALAANVVYLAPGGKQMKVTADGPIKRIRVTDDPPEGHCKPAVDYLFRSVAHDFPGKATAVILTGMGNDGTLGLRLIKRHGGHVIAQDEATCIVFGMPREAIEAGVVDVVTPLPGIADEIVRAVRGFSP